MNPYTQSVSNNVLSDMNRAWEQQEQAQRADAAAAGAFGGSRHGIADALTASEFQRNYGQMSDQLWNQAYGAATNMMGQDLNRGLQAALSNQAMDWNTQNLNANLGTQNNQFNASLGTQNNQFNTAQQNAMNQFNAGQANAMNQFNAGQFNNMGLQNAMMGNNVGMFNVGNDLQAQLANLQNSQYGQGLGLSALQSMGNIGQAMGNFTQNQGQNLTNYGISGLNAQQNAGNLWQAFQQQQLDDQYRQFLEARDWQANNFGQFAGMGLGAQGNTTTTGQAFGPSKASQIAGLGSAGAGIYGAFAS